MTDLRRLEPERVRILLVDDGPEHLLALRAILERPDYELVTARSGEDALIHVLRSSFALILMDVAMPKLDGFETATLIRQREAARRIPIIFVSGATCDIEDIYRGYATGAVDFLAKPLDPHAVRSKVAVFVEPLRQAREIEQAGQALREAERRERELIEAMYDVTFKAAPIGIGHLTLDARWMRVNHRLAEIAGRPPAELSTLRLPDLLHPEDKVRFTETAARILPGPDRPHRGEYRFVRPDGSIVWTGLTISILRDPRGSPVQLMIVEDVSDQRRLLESLRVSEASFARLRESGLLGVAFEAADGTLTDANDAFLGLIGHSRDDLLAQRITVRDLIPPERGDVEARAREALRTTGVCGTYETEYLRQDGLRTAVLVGAAALALPERGVIRFALDITERKRIEQERARIFRELSASVQARDDFLSIAAHELRNPLSPILMMVTSLLAHSRKATQPISPAWLVRQLDPVHRAVLRMERLIDELLDFSRVTVGHLPLSLEDVDMSAIVRDVVARMHPEIARARCPVVLRAGVPVLGRWDRTRLEQVTSNLLGNAVRYGAGKPIELETEGDEELGRLSIRDYGVGIAPEDQARIFDRFERLAPVRHYGGFGLGLWVTRQIVEAHGGTIRVWSQPGEGSRFTIELPRTPPQARRASGQEHRLAP